MAAHNDLGWEGEKMACEFLLSKGFEIIATNWRNEKAEADIIAKLDELLVLVEVKTRATEYFGVPEESVGLKKQRMMVRAAEAYIETNNVDCEVRYDVVAVIINNDVKKIVHIEDAFYPYASELDE